MSMHRLSAGSGYQYLLRHTASGDVQRLAGTPLTTYYTASGYPPGRWLGGGLTGFGQANEMTRGIEAPTRVDPPPPPAKQSSVTQAFDPRLTAEPQPTTEAGSVVAGGVVTEEQMARLYGRGEDPVTGNRLGAGTGSTGRSINAWRTGSLRQRAVGTPPRCRPGSSPRTGPPSPG